MWCEPEPITVSLNASTFKKMGNLKFLIVENVQNSKELIYLSNELRLFEWSGYNFSLPSKFCPQKLVGLKVSNSCISLFKQVWVYYLWIFISLNVIFKIRWNKFFFFLGFYFLGVPLQIFEEYQVRKVSIHHKSTWLMRSKLRDIEHFFLWKFN